MPRLQLYSGPTPNGRKVGIMLTECDIDFDGHFIDIMSGDQLTPAFLALNPNNKHPVIVDPEGPSGNPVTVWESGAILMYLAEKCGQLLPTDPERRIEALKWLFFQVSTQGPMAGQFAHFAFYASAEHQYPYAIERYRNEMQRQLKVMDAQLANREYFACEYSIADIALYPYAVTAVQREAEGLPHLRSWLDRIGERKAVRVGMSLMEDCVQAATIAGGLKGLNDEHRSVLFGERQYRR